MLKKSRASGNGEFSLKHPSSKEGFLDGYIKDNFVILDFKETAALVQKAQNGDIEARNKLIAHNLRFILKIANGYREEGKKRGYELQELVNTGVLGLIEAIKKYDSSRGYQLMTYACWWIWQAIIDALRKSSIVHIPNNRRELWQKILHLKLDIRVTEEEIAALFNVHVEKIRKELVKIHLTPGYLKKVKSLDEPISLHNGDGDETLLYDILPANGLMPVEAVIAQDEYDNLVRRIWQSVESIKLAQRRADEIKRTKIFCVRFGLDGSHAISTLKEVGVEYNLSRERVRQIERRVWNRLFALRILKTSYKDFKKQRKRQAKIQIKFFEFV